MPSSLPSFFSPKGVAVIGASADPVKLGYGLARNLVQSNYQGVVHFVNPKGGSLFGRAVYPSVAMVPDPVDLAILLIPVAGVPQALCECGKRGIRAAIIGSGGFRETGLEGAAMEAECLQIARRYGMRILGPNCIGFLDTHLPIDATFLPPPGPLPGDVAFISHSGAICAAVIDWARGQSFGLSRLISLGNQADLNETDLLAPTAADPFTRVLTLYLEGIQDGRRFVEEARQVTQHKPVLALKVGRFSSGRRAVASHTGALAGEENAYHAAFRRAGVIRADTSEELFDWARALAWSPPPQGRAMAVLTNAGGPGVTAADAIEANALRMATLSEQTQAELRHILPPAASLHNPVDMLASATPEQYAACLRILLADPEVHGVLVILPPPPLHTAGAVARAIIPVIHFAQKPVIIALMGERLIQEAIEHFRAARVPEYRFPERAASAMAILAQRAEYLTELEQPPLLQPPLNRDSVREFMLSQPAGAITSEASSRILAAYGIPVLPTHLAVTVEQAVAFSHQVGLPVALKVASPDLAHKSDVGGVMLNLGDAQMIRDGYATILANAHALRPEANIQGVYVQPMLPAGQDVIIGTVQDAQFGALAMFGSGGVEVEGLKDVSFGLAPLPVREAEQIIDDTWAGRKLRGYRNLPAADRQAVVYALCGLAQLAADHPELNEIEINPLRVMPEGKGVYALDVRMFKLA